MEERGRGEGKTKGGQQGEDVVLTLEPTSTLSSRTLPGMGAPTWPLMDFWALGWNFISCGEGERGTPWTAVSATPDLR